MRTEAASGSLGASECLRQLVRYWKDDPDTWRILAVRARGNDSEAIAAVEELAVGHLEVVRKRSRGQYAVARACAWT